jgi:hypothetical protein
MDGLNDLNLVVMEGMVSSASEIKDGSGVAFQDFTLETTRKHSNGIGHYKFPCVLSDKVLASVECLEVGDRIRIRGHLQESTYMIDENHKFTYGKVRVDFIEI